MNRPRPLDSIPMPGGQKFFCFLSNKIVIRNCNPKLSGFQKKEMNEICFHQSLVNTKFEARSGTNNVDIAAMYTVITFFFFFLRESVDSFSAIAE